jgi:hypothetical protein
MAIPAVMTRVVVGCRKIFEDLPTYKSHLASNKLFDQDNVGGLGISCCYYAAAAAAAATMASSSCHYQFISCSSYWYWAPMVSRWMSRSCISNSHHSV